MGILDTIKGLFVADAATPAAFTAAAAVPVEKSDGWENNFTGLGTSLRDKTMQGSFQPSLQLGDVELSEAFHGDDLAGKIVEFRPKEMFRRGYSLSIEGDDDAAEELEEAAKELFLNDMARDAMIWARLYGGALLIIGAVDGQLPTMPLQDDRVRDVSFLNVVDRTFCYVASYYSDPLKPKFGRPEIYQITNAFGSKLTQIHETRVIRFDGAPADNLKRRQLAGWTPSVLQRPYAVLRDFASSFQAAANLLVDASQGVFKMKGVIDAIASNNVQDLQTRMQLTDMMRSSARALILDVEEGEEFTRVATSLAGIPDMLDRFMMRVAAAGDTPVSILFGRSAAGMNATGDLDVRMFYDTIASDQENILEPVLRRIYSMLQNVIGQKGKDFKIVFRPLWQPTDAEQAALELSVAQKDKLYVDMVALLPEEVALNRWASGRFSAQTTLSKEAIDARKEALKDETRFEPPPPMVAPGDPTGADDGGPVQMPAGGDKAATPKK